MGENLNYKLLDEEMWWDKWKAVGVLLIIEWGGSMCVYKCSHILQDIYIYIYNQKISLGILYFFLVFNLNCLNISHFCENVAE